MEPHVMRNSLLKLESLIVHAITLVAVGCFAYLAYVLPSLS